MVAEMKNVSKRYGRDYALKSVSLQLHKGKIYGLLGPNGSGKSTTLKLLAGLVEPQAGSVIYKDKKVNKRIAPKVAYLSELDIFYNAFNVEKMISFYATQFPDFSLERADELLTFMGLEKQKKLKHLSKGSRGRLKLVLALSREPELILLDEPFSGLDPMVRESIVKGLLSYLDFENQTVLIATHEVDEIESILDEAYVLADGKIIGHCEVEILREEQGLSVLEWLKKTTQS
ncbi:ABC-2 type transport system ATP-binding protein [Bacillus pakistanensis]|uniref:ABC-2 type transport system ATP-binding protein n=1 Tax=Rossellomorea pakistanensis TaxID=992288 RepID=A0ABS2NAB0_9BACI|nr:ABC transporter ATP-binding protein [Bacillus pakistanensis]MBM7584795.1 ABC-2 type transport system ATP-binding protein [Bacillus pakistanensis]